MAYSVKSLAEKWECSPKHIYSLINDGKLKSFSIGTKRGTRISDEEVKRWEGEGGKSHGTGMGMSPLENPGAGGLPTTAMGQLANARG